MQQTIEQLVDELDIDQLTEAQFNNERARLAKKFYLVHGVSSHDEIDELIREGKVRHDELVQEWINLHALGAYIAPRESRPPKPARATPAQAESRESGSFYFRPTIRRALLKLLYSARWTRRIGYFSKNRRSCSTSFDRD